MAPVHPEVVVAHRERLEALSERLAKRPPVPPSLLPEDEDRLRSLRYLEE